MMNMKTPFQAGPRGATPAPGWLLFVLGVAAVLAGCSRDKDPQARAVADPQQIGLTAVSLTDHYLDPSLFAAAATGDEAAKPSAAAKGDAEAVTVDTSTPETTAKSYVDVINSGQIAQLPPLLMQDQQQTATELVQIVAPVTEAAVQLHKTLIDKHPGHAFAFVASSEAIPADWLKRWTVAGVEVDANDANTATAKLQVENTQDTATRTLKKVEEKWHVQEANLPTVDAAKASQEAVTQLAEAMKGLAGRVEGGEFADADAADKELQKVLSDPAAAVSADAAPAPAEAKPAAPPAPAKARAEPKADRPKSELEQDMDNAALRNTLGGP